MEPVYTPVVAAVTGIYRAVGWQVRVTGAEHVPRSGPGVIATNHVGYLDFTFVGYGVRERGRLLRFLAKKEIFDHPVAGPLMKGMRHIPVDRFGRAVDALRAAEAALERGELVAMFPEGTISRSFVPAAGKSGAARMALDTGAPLIPGSVWGSQRLLTKGRSPNLQRNVIITVDFGPPVAYQPGEDAGVVTSRLMEAVNGLVAAAARDYPQRPAGPDDRWWLPASLGGTAPTVEEAARIAAAEAAERRARRRAERDAAASPGGSAGR